MTPKLLSQEEREEIIDRYRRSYYWRQSVDDVLLRLLAAEQYWREVVKRIKDPVGESGYCEWCDAHSHKPDCPWLIAQGGEG